MPHEKLVLVPIAGEDWILDRLVAEFIANTKLTITNDIASCDTIFLIAPFIWKRIPRHFLAEKKLIVWAHHFVPNKFNQQEFAELDAFVNQWLVPNKHTHQFLQQHTSKPIERFNYWLNPNLWIYDGTYNTPGKFIVGSFQRDTEGAGCDGPDPQPKLEKGPDNFLACVKLLHREYGAKLRVLLAGTRRQWIIKQLKECGIDCIYIENASQATINRMYEMLDLYIVGSRYEGGPQAILECAYKRIPIISTDCGIASEILHPNCVFDVTQRFYLPTSKEIEYMNTRVCERLL